MLVKINRNIFKLHKKDTDIFSLYQWHWSYIFIYSCLYVRFQHYIFKKLSGFDNPMAANTAFLSQIRHPLLLYLSNIVMSIPSNIELTSTSLVTTYCPLRSKTTARKGNKILPIQSSEDLWRKS